MVAHLELFPIGLREANQYIKDHHRHHPPVTGYKFAIGCKNGENVAGIVIAGRPVSRYLDDGWTLEVTRLCTDGTQNACSILYSAAWRAAKALGYRHMVTYILESEPGTSLEASGWKCTREHAGGLQWNGIRKPDTELYPAEYKKRYEVWTDGYDPEEAIPHTEKKRGEES